MARRGAAGCIAMLRAVLNSTLLKRSIEVIEQQRERVEDGNLDEILTTAWLVVLTYIGSYGVLFG